MEAQYVPVAAGAVVLDVLDANFWFRSSFISIASWRDDTLRGFFCPLNEGMDINFSAADKMYLRVTRSLKQQYGYETLGGSELHNLIRTFSRFVTTAVISSKSASGIDNAFLQYVIALDLIFGDRDASNQSISRRVAIVCSLRLEMKIPALLDLMKQLYGIRSKYVHEGARVSEGDIDKLKPIIASVFHCLMTLQMRADALESGFVALWLKQLDYLYAGFEAGKAVSPDELVSAGLAPDRATP